MLRYGLVLVVCVAGACAQATELPKVVLGDYDTELRGADGHVDIPLMIQRLQDMHANTYMWLIWHEATDWEDLQRFLPEAEKAKIQVWAYLCPHSEQGPEGRYPFSEPYRLDFVKWAEEIAKLSLKHPNLVGWVIDDFMANFHEGAIPPSLVAQMQKTAKAINPQLRFYPLMYFREFGPRFAQELAPLVDGVVAAYHQGPEDIKNALPYLNDDYEVPPGLTVQFPPTTPSTAGDQGMVSQVAKVQAGQKAVVRFDYKDSYDGPTTGYHVMQLRIDDEVAWAEDIGGADDGQAEVDVTKLVAGKEQVKVALGVIDLKGVAEYSVSAQFADLKVEGLTLDEDLGHEQSWQAQVVGKFAVQHGPKQIGQKRYKLPLIVMPAGARGEYKGRYTDEPTAEHIVARTRQALELMGDGRVIGTVMYCLDKGKDSEDLKAISDLFAEFTKD